MSLAATQVAEFVRALAMGWKNLAAYPPGHPALLTSLDLIQRRLAEVKGPAGEILFGIARDGLVFGEEKIDTPYAQKFANALYTRGVALVRFDTDTEVQAIETFLRLIAVDSGRPMWEDLNASGVTSIYLQPVDYSELQISDTLDANRALTDAEQLWENILQALMSGHELTSEGKRLLTEKVRSASELAELILKFTHTMEEPAEFDPNATFGVKFTFKLHTGDVQTQVSDTVSDALGAFIATSSGTRRETGVRQAVELLKSLPESMRRSVIRAVIRTLAAEESTDALLRDFTSHLSRDEVLVELRHLATSMALASHATRLLESLLPSEPETTVHDEVPPSLVEDLVNLFGDDDIDRWNPEDHDKVLEQISSIVLPDARKAKPRPLSDLGNRVDTMSREVLNERLITTLTGLLRKIGTRRPPEGVLLRLESMFRASLDTLNYAAAAAIARGLQEAAKAAPDSALNQAIHETFDRIGDGATVRRIIDEQQGAPPELAKTLQELLDILGTVATKNLLIMLAEESNRSRRRKLFDFVVSLGPIIVPEMRPFLSDTRWFVVRNMISLIRAINDRTLLPEVRKCAAHPDLRVRMEAIKALLALEPNPPKGLLEDAIHDPDPKVAEKAITLVGSYGIREAIGPLLHILSGADMWGTRRPRRILALRALGALHDPSVLQYLKPFFSDSILPWPAKEERRIAYETLAAYPPQARAAIVERGKKSRDPYIRQICENMKETVQNVDETADEAI
jgi:HEAT repeat protein